MNRICVIKAGSAVITGRDGSIDKETIEQLCMQILLIHEQGWKPVLVTSGAVASGRGMLKPHEGQTDIQVSKRSCAAIGQSRLLSLYNTVLESWNFPLKSGQVLLTREAFSVRERYTALRETLQEMLSEDILPIINNNDVINVRHLDFTDNDQLASYIAGMLDADILILLSDIDGVYTANPKTHQDAQRITNLSHNLDEWPQLTIDDTVSSAGGMKSKLAALKFMASLGIPCCIARGRQEDVLTRILVNGDKTVGTFLDVPESGGKDGDGPKHLYKRWLATGALPVGTLIVSNMGSDALRRKAHRASLLAAGIESVYGSFDRDEILSIRDEEFQLLGVGRTRFGSSDLRQRLLRSEDVVVVHADYFVGTARGLHVANTEKSAIESLALKLRQSKYACLIEPTRISVTKPEHNGKVIVREAIGETATQLWLEAIRASRALDVTKEEWILYSLMGGGETEVVSTNQGRPDATIRFDSRI